MDLDVSAVGMIYQALGDERHAAKRRRQLQRVYKRGFKRDPQAGNHKACCATDSSGGTCLLATESADLSEPLFNERAKTDPVVGILALDVLE